MKFWDSSALVPLLVREPSTTGLGAVYRQAPERGSSLGQADRKLTWHVAADSRRAVLQRANPGDHRLLGSDRYGDVFGRAQRSITC